MDTKITRIKNKLKFNQIAKKHSLFIVSAKSGHLNNGHVKPLKNMIKIIIMSGYMSGKITVLYKKNIIYTRISGVARLRQVRQCLNLKK